MRILRSICSKTRERKEEGEGRKKAIVFLGTKSINFCLCLNYPQPCSKLLFSSCMNQSNTCSRTTYIWYREWSFKAKAKVIKQGLEIYEMHFIKTVPTWAGRPGHTAKDNLMPQLLGKNQFAHQKLCGLNFWDLWQHEAFGALVHFTSSFLLLLCPASDPTEQVRSTKALTHIWQSEADTESLIR